LIGRRLIKSRGANRVDCYVGTKRAHANISISNVAMQNCMIQIDLLANSDLTLPFLQG